MPAVKVHLESCATCREYTRRWERVREGLHALREESVPQPSLGFTTRLMRRLETSPVEYQFGQQLIDQIARRVLYASLMVALTLALILLLPSSGPLRSSGISNSVLVQAQVVTVSNEQVLGIDGVDSEDSQDSSAASTTNSGLGVQGSR